MSQPVPESVATEILDALAPMLYADMDPPQNDALTIYISAICNMLFQEVEDYASDNIPMQAIGWSQIVDLNRTPDKALPWLAQFVGAEILGGQSVADQRAQLANVPNWKRGSPQAMIQVVQGYLTGTKTVILRERDGGPWKLTVVTYTAETPAADLPTTNLVQNGGFETNATGWAAISGSSISRDTTVFYSGIASLKTVTTSVSGTGCLYGNPSPTIPATVGTVYSASTRIKAPIGVEMELSLDFRTAALISLGAGGGSIHVIGTGNWQYVTVTGTAPATTAFIFFEVYQVIAGVNTFWVDEVQVEQRPVSTPYVPTDGSTASRLSGGGPVGAALLTQKPAGIVMTYVVEDGWDYQSVIDGEATYAAIISDFLTYTGLLLDNPGT